MAKERSKISATNQEAVFNVSEKIYSKDIIFKACYAFIDKFYIYLDKNKTEFSVRLRSKDGFRKGEAEKAKGEFLNELLNGLVRKEIFSANKKLVETIVEGAIAASLENKFETKAVDSEEKELEDEVALLKKEIEALDAGDDYESDPLNIRTIIQGNAKKRKK